MGTTASSSIIPFFGRDEHTAMFSEPRSRSDQTVWSTCLTRTANIRIFRLQT